MNPMFVPQITETVGRNKKVSDLPSKLLENNIIYFGGELDEDTANLIIMELLWLSTQTEEINLYINSCGGLCSGGLAIKDVIYNLKGKGVIVNTIGVGECCSMGAYLLACGTGTRSVLPSTRVMVHSVISGHEGSYPDMKIAFEETERIQKTIARDLVSFSKEKMSNRDVKKMMDRNTWLNGEEAIKKGLVDAIL